MDLIETRVLAQEIKSALTRISEELCQIVLLGDTTEDGKGQNLSYNQRPNKR